MNQVCRGERLYRALLRFLPAEFRREASRELIEVFREGYERARRSRPDARLVFWSRTVVDLILTLATEWSSVIRARRGEHRSVRWTMDVRLAWRRIRKAPVQSGIVIGTLGIGIAAPITIGVLHKDIIMAPLPYSSPDRLMRLAEVDENGRSWWPSFPNARDWREHATVLEGVAVLDIPKVRPVVLDRHAVQAPVARLGLRSLETLGVEPARGRGFLADEHHPGGPAVAIISWEFWHGVLNAEPLAGLTLTVGREQYDVVGALPPSFRVVGDAGFWTDAAVWLPLERFDDLGGRQSHGYHVIGRLPSGVSLDRAQQEMGLLAARLRESHGEPTQAHTVGVAPLDDYVLRDIRAPLRLLFYGGVVVMIVTCVNLATTLLAAGLERTREFAVRTALGAGRGTLVRQLLIESAVLAVPGSVLGLALTASVLQLLRTARVASIPRLDTVSVDPVSIGVAVAVGIAVSAIAALVPAILLSDANTGARLRTHGITYASKRHTRTWQGFIVAQVALTLVLLFGSGLLLRSFRAALDVPLGYDPTDVIAVHVSLPETRYREPAASIAYYDRVLDQLRALPGVEAVGMASLPPYVTQARITPVGERPDGGYMFAAHRIVDLGYFSAIGIPIVRAGPARLPAGEAMVDAGIMRELAADSMSSGTSVTLWGTSLRIAGVVGSVREWNQEMGAIGAVYVDYRAAQTHLLEMHIMVRTTVPFRTLPRIQRLLQSHDPLVPFRTSLLEQDTRASLADREMLMGISSAFGLLTLFLAAIGVYSVVAVTVHRRRQEMRIRLVLGANPQTVRRHMIMDGLRPTIVGLGIGTLVTIPAARTMESLLFAVSALDPLTLSATAVLLFGIATAAAYAPTWRAVRVKPTVSGE